MLLRAALVGFMLAAWAAWSWAATDRLTVCLYFDGEENAPGFAVGARSAVMVRNLLGHFNEADVLMTPVSRYSRSELSGCDRAIYMGTYYEGKLPDAFLADVAEYRHPFLWMNYNIWKLQQRLGTRKFAKAYGFEYQKIDRHGTPPPGEIPHFFSTLAYKGATFRKVAQLDAEGRFIGHPDIVLVRNHSAQVLSEATHSKTGASTPYALRKDDFFYVADNPVSVIDERDRYLILADLLFDFLKLAPRSEKRYAVVRIEDIHPGYNLQLLRTTTDVFKRRKVPFAISLIPRYVGPETKKGVDATRDAKFLAEIRYAMENGATILMHGYEHQLTVDLGCGVFHTGEGYEFWDVCKNGPLPFDSVEFVERRLRKAKQVLKEANIPYAGWVTPHYAASPLAIRVIHSNFGRVLQRMRYFVDGKPVTPANAIDQFFPYTITHDYFGVYVWPENLGYIPLPISGGKVEQVDEMLEIARLNKVVRDAWASFFWHPVLIKTPLGIQSLERLVDGIRAEGYEFVSLHELRQRGE